MFKEEPDRADLALQLTYLTFYRAKLLLSIPTVEDPRPLWRDYSYWNGYIDGAFAEACGVFGGFGRSGISWTYLDPTFANFWEQFGLYKLHRSSYHVIHTTQSVVKQADQIWYKAHPERELIARMIDLEADLGDSDNAKADATWEMSELVLSRDGVRPIIYSRRLLLNKWLKSWTAEMLNSHKYMLAQYLSDPTKEDPGPPIAPDRVSEENILWHQSADTFPGCTNEVENSVADRDRWQQGDETQMEFTIQNIWGVPEPPEEIMATLLERQQKIILAVDTVYPTNTLKITVPLNEIWEIKHIATHINKAHTRFVVQAKTPLPDNSKYITILDSTEHKIGAWEPAKSDLELSGGYTIEAQVIGLDADCTVHLAVAGKKTILP